MNTVALGLVLQLFTVPPASRPAAPVLSFPDPSLDDTAAYQGYLTRFFRDFRGNTAQIYVDNRAGRVVHLLADAENESIGFTVRDESRGPARVDWASERAIVSGSSRSRTMAYDLTANAPRISIGWFVLGSMRVERDFQYAGAQKKPFASPPFVLAEMERLLVALDRLDAATRARHLSYLNAATVADVRARLRPTVSTATRGAVWAARIVQPSLDGRDTLSVELSVDSRRVGALRAGDSLSFTAKSGQAVPFTVAVYTTGKALTPLTREEIFNAPFLRFLTAARRDSTTTAARWLERETRGVQLLSSHEKLMAGLPAYATYFGRDMLVSALMMRPIWRADMSAFVIASVLKKLSPAGEVSHEEALGGQADREAADEYARLVDSSFQAAGGGGGDRTGADSLLARAGAILRQHRRVRENYHMIDDEFQLPVLEARWLADSSVTAARKFAFLLDSTDGEPRVRKMLRELALVSRMTAAYIADPLATNLVSFAQRDSGQWQSASWRDSNEGYAGGRFAMDVNAVWAPHALESMAAILHMLPTLGVRLEALERSLPELGPTTPLGSYLRDPRALQRAIDIWKGASRHFVVALSSADVQTRVRARLAVLPEGERVHWTNVIAASKADQDSLSFLALSLDASGHPIAVANSDPATRLFLADSRIDSSTADLLRDVRLFGLPYPVGLFIDNVGPVVANDAYAPPSIWPQFERDQYHGPRVVWGREVNLFMLGVTRLLAADRDPATAAELRGALSRVQSAVDASAFHSELWTYGLRDGRIVPVRYSTGSDLQLWSMTDLAVQFALSRLRH